VPVPRLSRLLAVDTVEPVGRHDQPPWERL
jgi:hypothetical protein